MNRRRPNTLGRDLHEAREVISENGVAIVVEPAGSYELALSFEVPEDDRWSRRLLARLTHGQATTLANLLLTCPPVVRGTDLRERYEAAKREAVVEETALEGAR